MRAKKFGVTDLSPDAKKLVRAERFGMKDNSSSVLSPVKTSVVSIYILKSHSNFSNTFFRQPTILTYLNKEQSDLEVQFLQ